MKAEEREIRRKRRVLEHAVESGNVAKTCRYFGVPRSSFYRWRNAYQEHGEEGLRCKKSIAKSHPNQTNATKQLNDDDLMIPKPWTIAATPVCAAAAKNDAYCRDDLLQKHCRSNRRRERATYRSGLRQRILRPRRPE